MDGITFRALPFAHSQCQRVVDISADMTPLAGWEESVQLVYETAVAFAFVFKHINELIPASVSNGLSKMVILNHVSDSEVFNMYRLVIADKFSACLMKEVASLIGNLLMLHGKSMNCFDSGIRAFNFSGYRSLKSFESLLCFTKILRWFDNLTVRCGDESLDSEVNTDFVSRILWLWNIQCAENGSVVFPGSTMRDSDRLHNSFNWSMNPDPNPWALRNGEFISIERPMLRDGKGLLISFLLEVWELSAFIEEVVVCNVQVTKCLLQRLGINFFEPFKFKHLFELRQQGRGILIGQTFLFCVLICGIEINALPEEIVIYEADTAKMSGKYRLLFLIWIYSVFECFMYVHVYNYSTHLLNCQYFRRRRHSSPG